MKVIDFIKSKQWSIIVLINIVLLFFVTFFSFENEVYNRIIWFIILVSILTFQIDWYKTTMNKNKKIISVLFYLGFFFPVLIREILI